MYPVCLKYRFCSAFLPVTRTLAALMMMTLSPGSIWGVNIGLCLPRIMFATAVAKQPRTGPSAATMYDWWPLFPGVAEDVVKRNGTICECRPPVVEYGS